MASTKMREGEEGGARDILSRGRGGSSTTTSPTMDGDGEGVAGIRQSADATEETCSRMWLLLSRNGLNMLAGCGHDHGFSLKPAAISYSTPTSSISNKRASVGGDGSERMSVVAGSGFAGSYRSSAQKAQPLDVTLRLPGEETTTTTTRTIEGSTSNSMVVDKEVELLGDADIQKLTREEWWRLILRLGTRWPTWKTSAAGAAAAPQVPQSPEPVNHSADGGFAAGSFEAKQLHQLGQLSLKMLAKRAIEELARVPDRSRTAAAGGMLAPTHALEERIATTAAEDAATPASEAAGASGAASLQRSAPSITAAPTTPQGRRGGPNTSGTRKTAPLTIFYAGTVNVCDNVPEDKAHLIMLLAERAGHFSSAAAQKQAQSGSFSAPKLVPAAPDARASPQKAGTSTVLPPELAAPSAQAEAPSSGVKGAAENAAARMAAGPAESPASAMKLVAPVQGAAAAAAESSIPTTMAAVLPQGAAERVHVDVMQRRQAAPSMTRPLPNARKNSLARFLDSRKRARVSTPSSDADGEPSKKPTPTHPAFGNAALLVE